MDASSSATAVRRSPLVAAVALVAAAVAAFALLLLFLARPEAPGRAARIDLEMTAPPSPGGVAARPPVGKGRRVPRLVAPPDHTAAQRAELAEVDRLARARAVAAVGLTAAEAQKAEGVYRAADGRRDQIEAEIDDGSIGKPSSGSPSRLWRHEGRVLAEMESALGLARAHALRAGEAVAYGELLRQAESRPGRTFPMSQRHARRRSSAMFYLQATIEAAHDGEETVERAPGEDTSSPGLAGSTAP